MEQSIRVTAKGDFNDLRTNLKNVKGDLREVTDELDRGARSGNLNPEKAGSYYRALESYMNSFLTRIKDVNKELQEQEDLLIRLNRAMSSASRERLHELDEEFNRRAKLVEVTNDQAEAAANLNKLLKQTPSTTASATSGGGAAPASSTTASGSFGLFGFGGRGRSGNLVSNFFSGAGKTVLGLAGLQGAISMGVEAYNLAHAREVDTLNLSQRIRGTAGRSSGSNTTLFDQAAAIGLRDGMGYSGAESWQFLDMYTRRAGAMSTNEQYRLMKFGRAYGLESSEVASLVGGNVHAGGGDPTALVDAIAGSVAQSGMTPRILEVMETNNTLLEQMNTTLKDGSAKQILAYQTTLDRIGLANGMKQLTGANGANIIGGLGGIFGSDPSNNWKWIGIEALQRYNPEKYGNMGLFGLESAFEDGLLNGDNLPALAKYIKGATGGDDELGARILQKWLQDGGYNATKTQASELWSVTNGLEAFSVEKMESVLNGIIDGGDKYGERKDLLGQYIMDVDARFESAMTEIGRPLVAGVTTLKEVFTEKLEDLADLMGDFSGGLGDILAFMRENLTGLALNDILGFINDNLVELGAAFGVTRMLTSTGSSKNSGGDGKSSGGGKSSTTKKSTPTIPLFLRRLPLVAAIAAGYDVFTEGLGGAVDKWSHYAADNRLDTSSFMDMMDADLQAKYPQDREPAGTQGVSPAKNFMEIMKKDLQEKYPQGSKPADVHDHTKNLLNTITNDTLEHYQRYQYDNIPYEHYLNQSFMPDAGDSDIGTRALKEFSRYNTEEFDEFRESGGESLHTLATEGKGRFKAIEERVSETMSGIKQEHAGFKTMMFMMFEPILSRLNLLGSSTSAGGYDRYNNALNGLGGYNAASHSGVTAAKLNAQFGGKLAGTGDLFMQAGMRHGIDPALLAAISMHETANGTSNAILSKNNVGGMMQGNQLRSYGSLAEGIEAMASNLRRNYIEQGLTTIEAIQKKYAPIGANNDPNNLNVHWVSGVSSYLKRLGVSGTGSVFNNWESKVTSRYGAKEGFRTSEHGGLDIDGEQGDLLTALAGGRISFIHMDDGSERDEDGKMNTRAGGTEVGVRMPDGKTYFYSHLSGVNPNLRVGDSVSAGDWLGNMGGDVGKAGSGKSTTGSHLHIGYLDENGNKLDPELLLRGLGVGGQAHAGDSSIGNAAPHTVLELRITGEGAGALNHTTKSQLEEIIRRLLKDAERAKLQLAPTKVGYGQ